MEGVIDHVLRRGDDKSIAIQPSAAWVLTDCCSSSSQCALTPSRLFVFPVTDLIILSSSLESIQRRRCSHAMRGLIARVNEPLDLYDHTGRTRYL